MLSYGANSSHTLSSTLKMSKTFNKKVDCGENNNAGYPRDFPYYIAIEADNMYKDNPEVFIDLFSYSWTKMYYTDL